MKKYIVFLVCLSVCISLLNITVFAEQEVDFNFEPQHPTGGIMLSEFQQTEDVSPAKSRLKVSLKTSPEIDFKTFLKEQLKNHKIEISFQDYNITENSFLFV